MYLRAISCQKPLACGFCSTWSIFTTTSAAEALEMLAARASSVAATRFRTIRCALVVAEARGAFLVLWIECALDLDGMSSMRIYSNGTRRYRHHRLRKHQRRLPAGSCHVPDPRNARRCRPAPRGRARARRGFWAEGHAGRRAA